MESTTVANWTLGLLVVLLILFILFFIAVIAFTFVPIYQIQAQIKQNTTSIQAIQNEVTKTSNVTKQTSAQVQQIIPSINTTLNNLNQFAATGSQRLDQIKSLLT